MRREVRKTLRKNHAEVIKEMISFGLLDRIALAMQILFKVND